MAMWSALLHPLLIAAALLYAPGGLIAIAARLPVRVVVALAPALSVAVIAGTGLLAPRLGPAWGVSVVAGATAIIVLAAIAAGKYLPPGWAAALLLAGAAYGLLGAWQARAGLQKQEQIEEA